MKQGDIVVDKSMLKIGDMSMPALITRIEDRTVHVEYWLPSAQELRKGATNVECLHVIESRRMPWTRVLFS